METQKDEQSGRHLIEGRGVPIKDGVFRRNGQPGIFVRPEDFKHKPWFDGKLGLMDTVVQNQTGKIAISMAVAAARQYIPIGEGGPNFVNGDDMYNQDRYSLVVFCGNADKRLSAKQGSYDAQALFVAMLLEMRNKYMKGKRTVAIIKDPEDGHAVVYYQGESDHVLKYDPTKGDTKFHNLSKK